MINTVDSDDMLNVWRWFCSCLILLNVLADESRCFFLGQEATAILTNRLDIPTCWVVWNSWRSPTFKLSSWWNATDTLITPGDATDLEPGHWSRIVVTCNILVCTKGFCVPRYNVHLATAAAKVLVIHNVHSPCRAFMVLVVLLIRALWAY